MAKQIKTPYGFIYNAPKLIFKRCDGTYFYSKTGSAANMSATDNESAVYGGWGTAPLGFTPGESGLEFSFTDAQFNADIFTISTTAKVVEEDYGILDAATYVVATGLKIELPFEVQPEATQINGFAYSTTAEKGKFTVTVAEKKTTITFAEQEDAIAVGDEIEVLCRRRIAKAQVTNILTTTKSARGELVATFPVGSAGEDCTQATIKGYYHVHVYRVKVSQKPGLDVNHGSAASPTLVFTALDSHRRDNKWYDLVYEELTPEGTISTDYGTSVTYD